MSAQKVRHIGWRVSLRTVALVSAAGLLSACASDQSGSAPVDQLASGAGSESSQMVDAPDWGHVHNLYLSGDVVYIGSHEGFWKQEVGQEPLLLSQPTFDVMGLAGTNQRWLASGHPGPDMDAPSDLGLIESIDGGVTWQSVSLLGEVDFHRLVSVADFVLGVSALDNSLLRSTDGGQTWQDLGTSSIFDLAINPKNPDNIFATTANGAIASLDGGITFTPVTTPIPLLLLAWSQEGLYAASVDGQVLYSTDNGENWTSRGSLGGPPVDLAADAGNVVGVVNDSVLGSNDAGLTFIKWISGAGNH
jgi:hypothetical protein